VKCFAELLVLYVRGKMKVQEDIQETKVSNYVQCVNMLYTGKNSGKLMMKVSEE
jgi:NADPH-dependent curcumin reductase CurA